MNHPDSYELSDIVLPIPRPCLIIYAIVPLTFEFDSHLRCFDLPLLYSNCPDCWFTIFECAFVLVFFFNLQFSTVLILLSKVFLNIQKKVKMFKNQNKEIKIVDSSFFHNQT